jgi:hypothetical protein
LTRNALGLIVAEIKPIQKTFLEKYLVVGIWLNNGSTTPE